MRTLKNWINKEKEKHLQREGINIALPWVLRDFGNISAASTIIALLRHLPNLKLDDHVLIDGFGAGTYYDTLVVALGRLRRDSPGISLPVDSSITTLKYSKLDFLLP